MSKEAFIKNKKSPTLRQKVEMYENFLHKINLCLTASNTNGVGELIQNADNWSYAHRVGNGECSDREQQGYINSAFWKLCDTPVSDKENKERRKLWAKSQK